MSQHSRFCFSATFGCLIPVMLAGFLIPNSFGQRRTPVIPPDVLYKDFDLVTTSVDANGLPLNPKWGQQVRDNTLPSPKASCPLSDSDPRSWTSARWPNCTSCPVFFNGADFCGHHVNFLPVTYEGFARWDAGPKPWPAGDDDYTFNMARADSALYASEDPQVHIEFDAGETVDQWDGTGTWWERFHHDGVDQNDDQAGRMLNGRFVIVTGLLGLDADSTWFDHRGKPELHPAYAVFVLLERNQRLKQASWTFFVRNWGNEGYCGGDQMNMYGQPFRMQIPGATQIVAGSDRLWKGARNNDDLSSMSVTVESNSAGLVLSFTLLTPESQSWIVGDLTVQERLPIGGVLENPPAGKVPRSIGEIANEARESVPPQFEALREQIAKLPESSRKELLVQQKIVVPRKQGTRLEPRIIPEPTQRGNTQLKSPENAVPKTGLVRPQKDTAAEAIRQKKLDVLKDFLARRRGVESVSRE